MRLAALVASAALWLASVLLNGQAAAPGDGCDESRKPLL
jgi:hypothetical protein